MALLKSLRTEFDMAVVLITHDLALVAEEADRVAVMYAGTIVETGSVAEVFAAPLHPYTKGLLDSVPVNAERGTELKSIGGFPPDLHSIPEGCAYQARCPLVGEICRTTRPNLDTVGGKRKAACHFSGEVKNV
jgi:oligopeptide transport system ATP-binding protein